MRRGLFAYIAKATVTGLNPRLTYIFFLFSLSDLICSTGFWILLVCWQWGGVRFSCVYECGVCIMCLCIHNHSYVWRAKVNVGGRSSSTALCSITLLSYPSTYLTYVSVLPVCMSEYHVYTWCLKRPEEGVISYPRTVVTQLWELNPAPWMAGWSMRPRNLFLLLSYIWMGHLNTRLHAYVLLTTTKWLSSELEAHAFNLPTSH